MKRLGICAAVLLALANLLSAQTPASKPAPASARPQTSPPKSTAAAPAPSQTPPGLFQKYCFECHGTNKPEAGLSIEKLVGAGPVGPHANEWERLADMLEAEEMPPVDATRFPTDAERAAAVSWIRSSVKAYELAHADEPGRVTVRRLTSGEYGYAIHDLTGADIPVSIDASSDSVGGEGFTNFGDVQFVEDMSIERYLEAAKLVADHAVVGAGPLEFYSDPGKTGLELSALSRINELYSSKGFRVVSGEGGRPFGLERYGKAFYVAWHYKNRAALGAPTATLRSLAEKEGITGRFAEHVWAVMNKPALRYPTSETVDRFKAIPAPTSDITASIARARAATDEIYKSLTTWPSWFFARGDLAAGGAGDESPLVFDDTTLKAVPSRHYTYALGGRGGRGAGARGAAAPAPAGPTKVHLNLTNLNPTAGAKSVVIWRNPHVITRPAAAPPGRGGAGGGAGAAGAGQAAVAPGAVVARGAAPAVIADVPLRQALSASAAAAFNFGTSPDGTAIGPNDFATEGPVSFEIEAAANGTSMEFQVDAELGADKNTIVRLALSDRPEGSSRDALQRVLLGDMKSAGYQAFRAGIEEYVASLPPNSHGEANPADKDPVPPPFDNTYNSPEHDAFVLQVKYQRSDKFFTDNLVDGADRKRLNEAWNDLFSSWPYHDAYLGMLIDHYSLKIKSRKTQDLTPLEIAAQPAVAKPYLTSLRAHYDEVMRTDKLAQPGHVENALAFASRAWRRPLTAVEKTSLRGFYQRARSVNGLDHDGAIRALIARVLVSPAFLYRVETVAANSERPLNGWEMASRMSFFLWSSVPDEELRRAAGAGELGNPAVLAKQVQRMTADPKARRLATEFFGQWLGFYRFDEYRGVDTGRFPEFTDEVKHAMYGEAVDTFEYIVRNNRPVKEMLYADYTFINRPLAKFYGVEKDVKLDPKAPDAIVKVDGANAFNRGGVLRMGTMLTVTSAPLRTSPVKRGDYVLRRILGTPTPPPPADAGSIPGDDKAFGGLTLRERLTQHKRNATCANCHLRIDPLGFPLETYDAIGRTRDTYADGKAVDTTGEFADKTTIVGTSGLLKYLQTQDAQVRKTLSKKMLGYALGRTVLTSDRALVDGLVGLGANASFADLATKVVTSRQFRYREGDEPVAPTPKTTAATRVAADRPPQLIAGAR